MGRPALVPGKGEAGGSVDHKGSDLTISSHPAPTPKLPNHGVLGTLGPLHNRVGEGGEQRGLGSRTHAVSFFHLSLSFTVNL